MISAKVIKDSIYGDARITTMQLEYPRFIHSEFMTHRVFSRNASSSRAIPVRKTIEQVSNAPAAPVHWGHNQPGMQAREELAPEGKAKAIQLWNEAAKNAITVAEKMNELGLHKQVVNRILEPFQLIKVVVTSTEWDNFFALRLHKDAQPEIQQLASEMKEAMDASTPRKLLLAEWHLPYISEGEEKTFGLTSTTLQMCSAARCARVSYMKHDGNSPSIEEDLELYNMLVTRPFTDKRGNTLVEGDPIHASPVEHQATPAVNPNSRSNNFKGWVQLRELIQTCPRR